MSFILEALKKSENKRRRKSGKISRTIHVSIPRNNTKSRSWILGVLFLLLVNAALLIWFFAPWNQSPLLQTEEQVSVETGQVNSNFIESTVSQVSPSATQDNAVQPLEAIHKQHPPDKKQLIVNPLPVPRNEKQIYSFRQLPPSVQRQIPVLKLSLHGYNRNIASASMVQLNDRIMHEGDVVAGNIRLEHITADGAVLRYDGYLFLLPRRGN